MLKVLHINISDQTESQGGMARLLHDSLPEYGVESTLFVYDKTDFSPTIHPLQEQEDVFTQKLLEKGRNLHFPEIYSPQLLNLLQHPAFLEADLVHLHATGEYFSYLLLPFLNAKPIVWSLYDCRPYTGGCFHSAHCDHWEKSQCRECPIDQRQASSDSRSKIYQLKQSIYQTVDLHVVCANSWQKQQVAVSLLKSEKISEIPLAIDMRVFHPGDKGWFRRALNLPQDAFILLFYCPKGMEESGGQYVKQALKFATGQHSKLLLVSFGAEGNAYFAGMNIELKSVSALDSVLFADYCRAADLLIHPHLLDQTLLPVLKAAACRTPAILFDLGPARDFVTDGVTGYIATAMSGQSLGEGILQFVHNPLLLSEMGIKASEQVWQHNQLGQTVTKYINIYRQAVPQNIGIPVLSEDTVTHAATQAGAAAEQAWQQGSQWKGIWQHLDEELKPFESDKSLRGIFVDSYCLACLPHVDINHDKEQIWKFVDAWFNKRRVDARCGHLPQAEKAAQARFCKALRKLIINYFMSTSLAAYAKLSPNSHNSLVRLWRFVFINEFSALALQGDTENPEPSIFQGQTRPGEYPSILIQSMFNTPVTELPRMDMTSIMTKNLPLSMKMILVLWLINAPFYNGTEIYRQTILTYIEDFCHVVVDKQLLKQLPIGFMEMCFEHLTTSLWRLSYLGGNHIKILSAYGDLLRAAMLRRFAKYERPVKKVKRPSAKTRVGYISMNFRNQAVSFYMADRILLHNPEKFEVYTFILKHMEDEMTEQLRKASDKVFEFTDMKDLEAIIRTIRDSQLDILIYADIGMDIITYQLGALRLAPIQGALVGHGTTSGLPTLDYYISGDFEPENGQEHYREQLVRLPNLGAAQISSLNTGHKMTRKSIGVPDHAVVFISCANGIKFYPERDKLLIEILRREPNAWIVLKPFQNPTNIDACFSERILGLARQHNVDERLIILPPLPSPADLMSLLQLGDVQLDTYPYGGWTTNMEALYAGLPIVTQEGDMARNRWGAAMLRALGVQEGIAHTEEEYIDWAVKLAQDKVLRDAIRSKIQSQVKTVLYNGLAAQPAYEAMLLNLINRT